MRGRPTGFRGLLGLLPVLLLACGGEAPPPAAPVVDAALVALARQDPAAEAARIAAAPDPLAQTALVVGLVDAGVPLSEDLCAGLPAGPARDRCDTLAQRPHLTDARATGARDPARQAPGPATTFLAPLPGVAARWASGDPAPADCPAAAPPACREDRARARLAAGDGPGAAALCRGVDGARWRAECFFHLAEQAAEQRTPAGQAAAAELCLGTGDYVARCYDHVARRLADGAPSAEAPPAAWAPTRALAAAVAAHWADRDPAFGRFQQDRVWSYALLRAAALQPAATGAPLAHLPAEVAPHVRAAAALRVVQDQLPPGASLAEAEAAVAQALAAPPPPPPAGAGRLVGGQPVPRWTQDAGADGAMPATFYLGSGRRTFSEDPVLDVAIAVVEAAAVVRPPRRALLRAAAEDPRPPVAWTARRLLAWLPGQGASDFVLAPAVEDEVISHPAEGAPDRPQGPPLPEDDPRVRDFRGR